VRHRDAPKISTQKQAVTKTGAAPTIKHFLSLRRSSIQNDFHRVQLTLPLDSVLFLNADEHVCRLLVIEKISNGTQDGLAVHAPGAAEHCHARVHEVFGRQTGGENVGKEGNNRRNNSLDVDRRLFDFSFDCLGGIPMRVSDVDFGSGSRQLFQTLHLEEVVVAGGKIADEGLPRALRRMHHLVRQTDTAVVELTRVKYNQKNLGQRNGVQALQRTDDGRGNAGTHV
jgi:hypothetical protein